MIPFDILLIFKDYRILFDFNYAFFLCSETERYKRIKWQDLRVGDIVHLSNNEAVPADILLLRTSDPHGVCYIDTCDLDGETNLKRREVYTDIIQNFLFL